MKKRITQQISPSFRKFTKAFEDKETRENKRKENVLSF